MSAGNAEKHGSPPDVPGTAAGEHFVAAKACPVKSQIM